MSKKSFAQLEAAYNEQHRHRVNVACHLIGIPLIIISLLMLPFNWRFGVMGFVVGWIFQFIGHWIEGKQPKFFEDPRYLFVGPIAMVRKLFRANTIK